MPKKPTREVFGILGLTYGPYFSTPYTRIKSPQSCRKNECHKLEKIIIPSAQDYEILKVHRFCSK